MELIGRSWSQQATSQSIQIRGSTRIDATDGLRGIKVLVERRKGYHILGGPDGIIELKT